MSDDSSEKDLPENEEENPEPEVEESESNEATEIDLEPVESDAGPEASSSVGLGQGSLAEKDEKLFAALAHFLAIISSFVGPLVIWMIKKDESPFVDDHGKEALNFQITLIIGYVISAMLTLLCIGYFMMMGLFVVNIIFCILAGIAANDGKAYRYPFALRLIK